LLFAQVLQISAVHRPKDSEIDAHGKGVGNCVDATHEMSPRRLPDIACKLNYHGQDRVALRLPRTLPAPRAAD
jgi:hypothetical protein